MTRFFRALFGGRSLLTRLLKRTIALGFVLVILLAVARAVAIGKADRLLDIEIAAVEKTDPRWKLADIVADRPPVADGENSVDPMIKARGLLPPKWSVIEPPEPARVEGVEWVGGAKLDPDAAFHPEADAEVAPMPRVVLHPVDPFDPLDRDVIHRVAKFRCHEPLDDRLVRDIRVVRERYLPALDELEKTLKLERGRHPVTITPMVLDTPIPTIQDGRDLVAVLRVEAASNIHRGRSAAAVEDIRMMLGIGRSCEHEPFVLPYLLRLAFGSAAVSTVERLLALGAPSADELLLLETLLAREEAEIAANFFRSLRTERACNFQTVEAVLRGKVAVGALAGFTSNPRQTAIEIGGVAVGPIAYRKAQARILRSLTETLRAEGEPFREQVARFDAIEARLGSVGPDRIVLDLAELLRQPVRQFAASYHRQVCNLRCARAGLLAEVFRLRNGRLPASVEELCASLKVPLLTDPWDDKPLKWKADGEGVSIYSVGKDGIDDGGKRHDSNKDEPGYDLVFRIPLQKAARR